MAFNIMAGNLVLKTTQQVCAADVDTIREVYLEAICVLAGASESLLELAALSKELAEAELSGEL